MSNDIEEIDCISYVVFLEKKSGTIRYKFGTREQVLPGKFDIEHYPTTGKIDIQYQGSFGDEMRFVTYPPFPPRELFDFLGRAYGIFRNDENKVVITWNRHWTFGRCFTTGSVVGRDKKGRELCECREQMFYIGYLRITIHYKNKTILYS